jgi:hypothetical protein
VIGLATLLPGSALGSTLLNVVLARAYLRKMNPKATLAVNLRKASAPARLFFEDYYRPDDSFMLMDAPVHMQRLNGLDHLLTRGTSHTELFATPLVAAFDAWETEYALASGVARDFWEHIEPTAPGRRFDVCAHIRRGDKLTLERSLKVHSIGDYADCIERSCGKAQRGTPFDLCVVTDDHQAYVEFTRVRPTWNICTTSSPGDTGFDINAINQAGPERVRREVERMLTDYDIIRRSDLFVGTGSSNVAAIAWLLREKSATVVLR